MSDDHLAIPGSLELPSGHDHSHSSERRRSGSVRSQHSQGLSVGTATPIVEAVDFGYRPSIRLRGFSNIQQVNSRQDAASTSVPLQNVGGDAGVGRNRSISAPQRPGNALLASHVPGNAMASDSDQRMPGLTEEIMSPTSGTMSQEIPSASGASMGRTTNEASTSGTRARRRAKTSVATKDFANDGQEYASNLIDYLDTCDPEVQTLNSLNNVQNSLFIPNLGRYLNRRPTYTLTRRPTDVEEVATAEAETGEKEESIAEVPSRMTAQRVPSTATMNTITSNVNDNHYAVLPHGVALPDWTAGEKLELDDHVRHMLHSKRAKFKRSMKGFGQYVRKPLGFFVTLYATLITLFGLAWVLFLIGWISVSGRQGYIINVIDNVLVALFAIMGDGLAPFRAVDTYHMIFIAHYHHLTWRLRREKNLPNLEDHNDLPPLPTDPEVDEDKQEVSVLNEKQQQRLAHHQKKFARSHSFYKPHETTTHHAFPLRLLVAIVVLLDCHSLLQISLGACTWGIYYKRRPFALTTAILCTSITVNITAGILILVGDKRTRKKDVLERMERQELTRTAMKKVERRRERESLDLIREGGPRESMDVRRGEGAKKGNTERQRASADVRRSSVDVTRAASGAPELRIDGEVMSPAGWGMLEGTRGEQPRRMPRLDSGREM